MVRYIKLNENDQVVEAPTSIVKNGKLIIGYNHETNEKMLFEDGYLKYTGTKPLSQLKIENGQIIEIDIPVDKGSIFTKLQIRRSMRKLNIENTLDGILSANFDFSKEWADAQEINVNDPIFVQAITDAGIDQTLINTIIDNIEE